MDTEQRIAEGFTTTFQHVDQGFTVYVRVIIYECPRLDCVFFEYVSAITAPALDDLREAAQRYMVVTSGAAKFAIRASVTARAGPERTLRRRVRLRLLN